MKLQYLHLQQRKHIILCTPASKPTLQQKNDLHHPHGMFLHGLALTKYTLFKKATTTTKISVENKPYNAMVPTTMSDILRPTWLRSHFVVARQPRVRAHPFTTHTHKRALIFLLCVYLSFASSALPCIHAGPCGAMRPCDATHIAHVQGPTDIFSSASPGCLARSEQLCLLLWSIRFSVSCTRYAMVCADIVPSASFAQLSAMAPPLPSGHGMAFSQQTIWRRKKR